MNCICGNSKYNVVNRDHYEVTKAGKTRKSSKNGVVFGECTECGIVRQVSLPFKNESEYKAFYDKYPPTLESYKAKDYQHDCEVARLRCEEYGIESGCDSKILDVGSGSGAFVAECRKRGAQAYGCEIGSYDYSECDDFTYKGRFEEIYFPTDHFDKVTCHDMLEHVLDPIETIKEMFRVTKQGGECIIDIPRFFHDSGKHHWKAFEHIWFFNESQLKKLLKDVGFIVKEVRNPIESKSVFYCTKPSQDRTTILVPPGIGDSYWSIIKIQAFLEREGLGIPDIHIASPREKKFQGHKRAFPFIEMFPFLNSSGITHGTKDENRAIWKEAYAQEGRTIFKNVVDCDYFISYNGHLRVGKRMEDIDPDLETNWFPPMFVSLEQENYRKMAVKKYGNYILFYFVFQGTYCYWTKEFPVSEVVRSVKEVAEKTNCTPIFVGAQWDAEDPTLIEVKNKLQEDNFDFVDLVGKTTMHQLFGLIRGSQMLIGYPSGLSIISAVLKAKTIIIWNDYYDRDFAWWCCPPETRGDNYFIERTKDLTAEKLADLACNILNGKKPEIVLPTPKKKRLKTEPSIPPIQNKIKSIDNVIPRNNEKIAIVCVLKSGGDFSSEYVERLRNMLKRHVSIAYDFYCFSDVRFELRGCTILPLKNNLQGCWSKIEIFKPNIIKSSRIVYFDLDTVIVDNIDNIININYDFIALKPWNPRNLKTGMFASGMMSWKNDNSFSYIYNEFTKDIMGEYRVGDQEYISKIMKTKGNNYKFYQDITNGVYSYKRNCRNRKPDDSKIICFHGKPRPHECMDRWVKDNWK